GIGPGDLLTVGTWSGWEIVEALAAHAGYAARKSDKGRLTTVVLKLLAGGTGEPPRVAWRLQPLRGWSHDRSNTVPARATCAGDAGGAGAPGRTLLRMGGDPVDRREAWDDARDAAAVAAAGRGGPWAAARDHQCGARADPGAGAREPRAAPGQRDPEGGVGFF